MTDDSLIFYCIIIFVFLLISAFFSAAETALTAISRARLHHLKEEGRPRAQLVTQMREDKESLIGAILIGNNLVNIAASAIATSIAIKLFDEGSLLIATGVMTALIVVFCEILPKTYAIHHAERSAMALAPPLYVVVRILSPLARAIQFLIQRLLKCFGVDMTQPTTMVSASDVVRGTIDLHHREGSMVKQDRDMLESILDLQEVEIEHITVHRTHVTTIDAELDAEVIIQTAVTLPHSRIPFYKGETDNIIGVLHVKDLIRALSEHAMELTHSQIIALLHKPWFIPETTSLQDQLLAFRAQRRHFACVVDEYGAWQGIVTLEDIIEEIVGQIDDEHDVVGSNDIARVEDDLYLIAGDVPIRDLNRQLGWSLSDEEAATIAGLILHHLRDMPRKGDEMRIDERYHVTILDVGKRRIKQVRVRQDS